MAVRETIALHSVTPDLIPADAPMEAWNSGNNVVFHNGESKSVVGDRLVFDGVSAREANTMVYVEPNATGYWLVANETGIYAYDGTTEFDITPSTGWTSTLTDPVWTSTVINGLAVINCSERDPVYWDGNPANDCVALPDWPSGGRCIALRAHKNFLFAIGMTSEGDQRVRWSDAAEAGTVPQEWAPAADNFAGFVDLAPLRSACLDGMSMRDDFLIYKEQSIHAATFIGGNDVFSFRKVFSSAGLAATNGVCRGPNDEHLFVGANGDVHLTDGVEVQSVLDGRAQRTFYADFQDPTGSIFSAATLHREKLGIIAYPAAGETYGTRAILYDFASGDIGFRDMSDVICLAEGRMVEEVTTQNDWDNDTGTWSTDTNAWNTGVSASSVNDVLMGTPNGSYLMLGGDLALAATLEKAGLAFGNPSKRKMVTRVWPKFEGSEGDVVNFRIGGQETAGGPVSLGPTMAHTIGSGVPLDCLVQGRFMTLLVDSAATNEAWRLGSIDVEYREVGGW